MDKAAAALEAIQSLEGEGDGSVAAFMAGVDSYCKEAGIDSDVVLGAIDKEGKHKYGKKRYKAMMAKGRKGYDEHYKK